MCMRCAKSGRMCDGYSKTRSDGSSPESSTIMDLLGERTDDADGALWPSRTPLRYINDSAGTHMLIPPDWDLLESFDYC